jgi:hypothetical protein
MEIVLRRLLGLYFVVSAVAYVPTALFYLGVENTAGPSWILVAIPLAQAIVFAVAGILLSRERAPLLPIESGGLVFPPIPSLLQLLGLYFIVEGLSAAARPGIDMMFFSENWWARVGNFAGAAVWLAAGWVLVSRPSVVTDTLSDWARRKT